MKIVETRIVLSDVRPEDLVKMQALVERAKTKFDYAIEVIDGGTLVEGKGTEQAGIYSAQRSHQSVDFFVRITIPASASEKTEMEKNLRARQANELSMDQLRTLVESAITGRQ